MIATTRREAMMGAVTLPTLAALPRWQPAGGRVLVHDPALAAGRRIARLHDGETLAIEGDRIRFAQVLFERRPSLVMGVSRSADALLIAEVGREAGYTAVAEGVRGLRDLIAAGESGEPGRAFGWVLAPRR